MALDKYDKQILEALQTDGRATNVDLARSIGLSESPCYRRARALEDTGVISRYSIVVDQQKIGLQVTAFVHITVERQDDDALRSFFGAIEAEEFIVECHAMSGSQDFLIKVVSKSMEHFSDLVMKRILRIPGVRNVESNFSLQAVKANAPLPLG